MKDIATLAVHSGKPTDPSTGAVGFPSSHSTIYARLPNGEYYPPQECDYVRGNQSTIVALEECLRGLEGGEVAVAFGSGCGATSALLRAFNPGDHIIIPQECYFGTGYLSRKLSQKQGLKMSIVDMTDIQAVKQAIQRDTKLVLLETPSSPTLKLYDIEVIADLTHEQGGICAVDSTLATPILQQPFKWGADVVVHSLTKYIGGHSNAVGGVVIGREQSELLAEIRDIQVSEGGIAPREAEAILQGTQTLHLRVEKQSESALKIAQFLQKHSREYGILEVYYPWLEEHPGYSVAQRQMERGGGIVSFRVGSYERVLKVGGMLEIFARTTSFGSVKSTAEYGAKMQEISGLSEVGTNRIPQDLIRLSVGIESPEDLITDLRQALSLA